MSVSQFLSIAVLSLMAYVPQYIRIAENLFPPQEHRMERSFPNVIQDLDTAPNLSPLISMVDLIKGSEPELPKL